MIDLLRYFHELNKARFNSDLQGKRVIKAEAKRVREKILFCESFEVSKNRIKFMQGVENESFKE